MASKRQLKKRISYVCGELATEILIASHMLDNVDRKAVNKIIGEIATLQTTSRDRVSVSFDKVPRDFENGAAYNKAHRTYFKKAFESLRSDFGKKVLEIVKDMNSAIPAEERARLVK
ncbi:MAG: hypothetical protein NC405_08810 [Odoribacter sp.]|nr:hypothetical protein [Odoribacter sp.]